MTQGFEASADLTLHRLPSTKTYILLLGLFATTLLMGRLGVGGTRILFILGSFMVAIFAYKADGLRLHAQVAITLFTVTPLLRRWVDLYVGYDTSGSMLVAPLLVLCAVFSELRGLPGVKPRCMTALAPHLIAACCLMYGWSISAIQGEFLTGSITAAKYIIPILYCACLIMREDKAPVVLRAAAHTFLLIGPFIGIYGVYQHLNPQPWDQMWMIYSKIDSIGLPEPGKVRVFSTMNSPVSFASYAACGLLLFNFLDRTFIPTALKPIVAILPLSLALLLTGVRAAWISAFVALLVCLICKKTRKKAGLLFIALGVGTAFAIYYTSFGDMISDRLSSLDSRVSDDGSGSARLHDYLHVFGGDTTYLFGVGFSSDHDSNMNALDGLLLSSAVQMGTVFGVLQAASVIWAGIRAVRFLGSETDPMRIVASALIIGQLAICLLTAISVGEIGFLYWMLVGIMTRPTNTSSLRIRRRPHRLHSGDPPRLLA